MKANKQVEVVVLHSGNVEEQFYFVSQDEIKSEKDIRGGEWKYAPTTEFWPSCIQKHVVSSVMVGFKKIIASTDPSLELPLIPQFFIEQYVKEQGRIKTVELECFKTGPAIGNLKLSNKEVIVSKIVTKTAIKQGNENDYSEHVRETIEEAAKRLYPDNPKIWLGSDETVHDIFKAGVEWYKNNH